MTPDYERGRQDALARPAVQEALAAAEAELGALASDRLNAMWVDANSHALSLQDHVRRYERETAQAEDERDTWRRHYRNLLRAQEREEREPIAIAPPVTNRDRTTFYWPAGFWRAPRGE